MSIPLFGELLQAKLSQRTLLLIARFGFSVMLIYTLFILTLYRLMLFHRKLLILTPFRFKQNLRQLLRPFSCSPAPQHRNQFSIAFPNPRKTNLFHSQIIQFLRPVPLN